MQSSPQQDNNGIDQTARLLPEREPAIIHRLPPLAARDVIPDNPRPLSAFRPVKAGPPDIPPLAAEQERAAAWQALVNAAPPEWWNIVPASARQSYIVTIRSLHSFSL